MTKILVLYHSSYGHIEKMAKEIAKGAQSIPHIDVDIKRVPELVSKEIAEKSNMKTDQEFPISKPEDLEKYDAIIFGTPTRFGMMSAQMRNFLDQTGSQWAQGKLIGKVGSVFTSTATQHGGHESTILSFHTTLLHHGMIIVGLPYSFAPQMTLEEITGGSPYGAGTIAGGDGSRTPSQNELDAAFFQGKHVAEITQKLT